MKRKMTKNLTAILVLAAMLVALIPIPAAAAANTAPTIGESGTGKGFINGGPIASGVKIEWMPYDGALGYIVYRTVGGRDASDWMAGFTTTTEIVDVEVDPNTEYTYQYAPVMSDGQPIDDYFGDVTVTTNAEILGGSISELELEGIIKNVILMKVDSPDMSVNGEKQEIDPGRGTAPIVMNNRTLVPIRAIIEAMDGTVGWEDATRKITLAANGHYVEMWLDKLDINVDGAAKAMDVAPTEINGRTMVPVRFAAENVGCVVDWIETTNEIIVVYYTGGVPSFINTGSPATELQPTPAPDPNPDPTPNPNPNPSPAPIVPTGNGPELRNDYSKAEQAKILSDIESIIRDIPTGGKQITFDELNNILYTYYKDAGDGNSWYSKSSYGRYVKKSGKWSATDCDISEYWGRDNDSRNDILLLADEYTPELVGTIRSSISNEDANFYYSYEWYRGDSEGLLWKIPKTPSDSSGPGTPYNPKVTLFDDAVVDGQECIVYCLDSGSYISYYWFSKSKGFDILYESIMEGSDDIMANITFAQDKVNKEDSAFDINKQGVTRWDEWD